MVSPAVESPAEALTGFLRIRFKRDWQRERREGGEGLNLI